jgi:threonine/homoserine/homoserine lactone efflux protein
METSLILSFLVASILLTIMPGPDNIFVLTESLTRGRKNGIMISIGLSLGVLIHTMAAATGLSIIIQKSAIAFSVIKYIGALYLFYLAFKSIKEKKENVNTSDNKAVKPQSSLFLIRKGFLMNVLNPKVALFFIAFLPQFISQTGINLTYQMLVLGIIFAIQALLLFVVIAYLSGTLTKYVNNDKFWNITKWSKVTVLSGLGLALVFSKK